MEIVIELFMIRKRPRRVKHAEIFGKNRLQYGEHSLEEATVDDLG